jgi:hypothetical protein
MNLNDHRDEHVAGIAAKVEAGRVEDITEYPNVGNEGYPTPIQVDTLGTQVSVDVVRQVGRRRGQMIGVAKRQDGSRIAAEQAAAPAHGVELVQVEREVPDIVLEPVADWLRAAVADLAEE